MSFKVGDIVERIQGTSAKMYVGDIGTVSKVIDDEWIMIKEYPDDEHASNRFVLVSDGIDGKVKAINKLISKVIDYNVDDELNRIQRELRSLKEDIRRYTDRINDNWKRYRECMTRSIIITENRGKDFSSDIKAILEHKYVKTINITGKKRYTVETDYIDIYDEDGNKFKGNKYNLIFDFEDMTCYIEGLDEDYNRKSYWTSADPHPHVNGGNGEACWGSAGSMLTESMNEHEIYASFLIVLNFLQQVNTDDPAGKHICNWDCIDEEGNDLDNPYENTIIECAICECEMDEEDTNYCEECGNRTCGEHSYWIDNEDAYVCENCYDNKFTSCDECDNNVRRVDTTTHDGWTYCDGCYDDLFKECYECGDHFKEEEMTYHDNEYYCSSCYDEKYGDCENCGNTVETIDLFYCNTCGQNFCSNCEEEPIPGMCQQCYDENEEEGEKE